jgi:uncharacterized protein (TIGR03067 family)
MKIRMLVALVICLGIAANEAKDADKKELELLQGDWQLVSAMRDGKAMPEAMVKATKCTVKGDKFTIFRDGKAVEAGTLKPDTSRKPKQIDIKLSDSDAIALGIYELDKDDFNICYAPPGKDRPTEFAAKEGAGHSLSVWKRHKE